MRDSENSNAKLVKVIPVLIVLLVLGGGVKTLWGLGNNVGYAPTQPIPFSHKKHAGLYNIPCMYCHANVEKSKHATVPSMNVCMNCHSVVKPDSPHIQKLKEHYAKGEAFEWIKVNNLPDYVNFSHKRHVLKGVACETCHGDVKKMDVVRQDKPLTMGWCLDCHRGRTTPPNILKAANPAGNPATGVPPHGVAPISCYTCHH